MTTYNFYTALPQLKSLYGVNMQEDDFETIGFVAWKAIGNKLTRTYRLTNVPVTKSGDSYYVQLPCNADIIEAVTINGESHQRTSSVLSNPANNSLAIETLNEGYKTNTGDLYLQGQYIPFTQIEDRLYFSNYCDSVNILYYGIFADEFGLPFLNYKEVQAIAAYCAYTDMFKQGMMTRNGALLQLAQALEIKWKKLCSAARVPEYLSQNEMDQILDASTSWNRKMYGKSYKPV